MRVRREEFRGKDFIFHLLGFLVGDVSFDKDGIRTAAIFNEMVSF